jgi:hypothetical protein
VWEENRLLLSNQRKWSVKNPNFNFALYLFLFLKRFDLIFKLLSPLAKKGMESNQSWRGSNRTRSIKMNQAPFHPRVASEQRKHQRRHCSNPIPE